MVAAPLAAAEPVQRLPLEAHQPRRDRSLFDRDVRGSLDRDTGHITRPHSPALCGSRGVERSNHCPRSLAGITFRDLGGHRTDGPKRTQAPRGQGQGKEGRPRLMEQTTLQHRLHCPSAVDTVRTLLRFAVIRGLYSSELLS